MLRYRNCAKITVLMCEQKPHLVYDFGAGARAIRYSLSLSTGYIHKNQTGKVYFCSHI